MESSYRTRIYNAYVYACSKSLSPQTIKGLKPRIPHLKRLIKMHFPLHKNSAILDLGCGYGALMHVARQVGYHNIWGVDGSPEQVVAARRLGIYGVAQGDVLETLSKQSDGFLDCIVAYDLIEHFTKSELIGLVDEVWRVLKTGGRWIIHTTNAESPFGMRIHYGDLTHELAFTRTSLSQLFLSSGFSRVKCYEEQPIIHGLKSSIRWGLWQGIRGLLRLYLAAETGDISREVILSQNLLAVAFK